MGGCHGGRGEKGRAFGVSGMICRGGWGGGGVRFLWGRSLRGGGGGGGGLAGVFCGNEGGAWVVGGQWQGPFPRGGVCRTRRVGRYCRRMGACHSWRRSASMPACRSFTEKPVRRPARRQDWRPHICVDVRVFTEITLIVGRRTVRF